MKRLWSENIQFIKKTIPFEESKCSHCGAHLYKSKNRPRNIYTMDSPLLLERERAKCSNKDCEKSKHWSIPLEEKYLTMPRWKIGWDVFCWIGFRRYKRHWSVTKLKEELSDSYDIELSEDAIEDYFKLYQLMVAEKYQDLNLLKDLYKDIEEVDLTIDGLQPEKGHETLYVVRDLTKGRVLFAEPLVSSSNKELQELFKRAKTLCEQLGVKVRCWMTDKQKALVSGVAKEFPDSIHRYCQNHFIRDLAKPMTDLDSKAKIQMRKKVRGLRTIEKEVLEESKNGKIEKNEAELVLNYCTAVKGILNDNKGGPLNPSGFRMHEGLEEVSDSLDTLLTQKGSTRIDQKLDRLKDLIDGGLVVYDECKGKVLDLLGIVKEVNGWLDASESSSDKRKLAFNKKAKFLSKKKRKDLKKMGRLMLSFESGLFAGGDITDLPVDNLDLERWFKKPKGHERRINGRKHAGVRLVYEGATLIPALDAHIKIHRPLTAEDLMSYRNAQPPKSQIEGLKRRKVMSQASSKKKDQIY